MMSPPPTPRIAASSHGGHGQLDCRRQRVRDKRGRISAKLDGTAKVAVQGIDKPDPILLRQRLIEAHFVPFGRDFFQGSHGRQRHRRRIDRKHAQYAEQERRDRQQDRYGREQTAREQLSNYSDHAATNSKN